MAALPLIISTVAPATTVDTGGPKTTSSSLKVFAA